MRSCRPPHKRSSLRLYSVDDDEIEDQCTALRKKLDAERQSSRKAATDARGLKSHQVHEIAKAKIEQDEKVRKAFGIKGDYEEGDHWKRQESRLRESLLERNREETRKANGDRED